VEQRALAQLSVFRGGWTLEAAQDTLSLELEEGDCPFDSVLDVIESLLEAATIRPCTRPDAPFPARRRFELHPAVAGAASTELSRSEDRDAVFRGHALWALHTFEVALPGSTKKQLDSILDEERENVYAVFSRSMQNSVPRTDLALRALIILAPSYADNAAIDSFTSMLESVLESDSHDVVRHHSLTCEALIVCGNLEFEAARFEDALRRFGMARDLASSHSNLRHLATATIGLAESLWYLSRTDEAEESLAEAQRAAEKLGELALDLPDRSSDSIGIPLALRSLRPRPWWSSTFPWAQASRRAVCSSRRLRRQTFARFHRITRRLLRTNGVYYRDLCRAGLVARLEAARGLCSLWSSPKLAEHHLERALLIFKDLDDGPNVALVLARLVAARLVLGRIEASEHCAHDALDVALEVGDGRRANTMRVLLAIIAKEMDRGDEAASALEGLRVVPDVQSEPFVAMIASFAAAELRFAEGSPADAAQASREAYERAVAMKIPTAALWACCGLGRAEAHLDDSEQAAKWIDEASQRAADLADPCCAELVEICRGHLDLVHARRCMIGLEASAVRGWLSSARSRLSSLCDSLPHAPHFPLRMATASLDRSIAVEVEKAESGLRIGHEGRWFALGSGDRVCLAKRRRPRRLLMALVEQRARHSGAGVDVDDLFRAVWPDEVATPESAANRVYVTITRLRKLGLADMLTCGEKGFCLDPNVPLIIERRERV
jgi:tetratricopeptide (TPR) repeat protein